ESQGTRIAIKIINISSLIYKSELKIINIITSGGCQLSQLSVELSELNCPESFKQLPKLFLFHNINQLLYTPFFN
ncbi:MAG: hypothetical protein B7Y76_03420, partial [Sphingobacteriia bacterium 35-40-5]